MSSLGRCSKVSEAEDDSDRAPDSDRVRVTEEESTSCDEDDEFIRQNRKMKRKKIKGKKLVSESTKSLLLGNQTKSH